MLFKVGILCFVVETVVMLLDLPASILQNPQKSEYLAKLDERQANVPVSSRVVMLVSKIMFSLLRSRNWELSIFWSDPMSGSRVTRLIESKNVEEVSCELNGPAASWFCL